MPAGSGSRPRVGQGTERVPQFFVDFLLNARRKPVTTALSWRVPVKAVSQPSHIRDPYPNTKNVLSIAIEEVYLRPPNGSAPQRRGPRREMLTHSGRRN